PMLPLPLQSFDAIVSNSLVHHMPDPFLFWNEVVRLGRPGATVLIMDLFRPESPERAREIVEKYAADEAPILKEDFYKSLCAASPCARCDHSSARGAWGVSCVSGQATATGWCGVISRGGSRKRRRPEPLLGDVEAEVADLPVAHDVVLAFQPE